MAIRSITIENFKCIGDAVTIPIRPITLLFGKNSSGKSTVLQALSYMVEVYEKLLGADVDITRIGLKDVGRFISMVHRHDRNREIHICLDFDLNNKELEYLNSSFSSLSSKGLVAENLKPVSSVSIEVVTGWDQHKKEAYTKLFIYRLNGVDWSSYYKAGTEPLSSNTVSTSTQWISLRVNNYINWNIKHPFIKTQSKDNFSHNANELCDIQKRIEDIVAKKLRYIRYMGPLREVPDRDFVPKEPPNEDPKRWANGLAMWDLIGRYPELLKKTNSYMKDHLKLGYTISLALDDDLNQKIIKLHNEENNIDLDLSDVGLGISQVVPVLVYASHTIKDTKDDTTQGIFAIEQPELHLHPAAQVALGDVFIDSTQNSSATFLIETHSEHLLLRIMRRMRETFEDRIEEDRFPVTPDDVAVLFVESHNSRTIIREMPVNERGDLVKAWPGGFFEEDIEEVLA